jgi:alpha-L-rhamnosidase
MLRERESRPAGIYALSAGGRDQPLGIPADRPRLSWSVGSDTEIDAAAGFEVAVFDGAAADVGEALWTSRTERPWVNYGGPALPSRARRRWRVEATTTAGELIAAESSFEIGLRSADDWSARWITAPELPYRRESWDPAPHLRQEFEVGAGDEPPVVARVYASALGLYRLWLNGVELTEDALLRPGWTDYRIRVYHQTFDVAAALRPGTNVLTAVLAGGWYSGRIGLQREPKFYGDRPALLAQLELEAADGSRRTVATDTGWRAGYGAIQATDLLRGEYQDLRQEPEGWRESGFDASAWAAAVPADAPAGAVEPQPHDSIAGYEVRPGELVAEHARGPAIYDFGQNVVGWTRVHTTIKPTSELIVRHGEILTPEKGVYRDNLRAAFQEDRYVSPDNEPRTVEPLFGFHGFRYAEVWGVPSVDPYGILKVPEDTKVEAVALTGLHRQVGSFECSNEALTRFAQNVEWTVRDNFLEAITDCPQRDERLGWLGDAGVIAPTAAYIFDVAGFVGKFVQDAADAQGEEGAIRDYVPTVTPADKRSGAPGWSDGYVRLVHLLVERYGDLATADRLFDSLNRFAAFIDTENPDGLRVNATGADFGDWLSLPEEDGLKPHRGYEYTQAFSTTPRPIVDTAHSYRTFVQLAEIADRLGHADYAESHRLRAEQIRQAYLDAFVQGDGSIRDATQTAYAQAIDWGIVRGEGAAQAAEHLRALIEKRGYLTTGIHGTAHVLPALCDHGMADLAVDLLLRDEMPSWLYMVGQGATTVWEKWDGIRPDGTLATAEMNSFNHCALGAVGRFLYERLAGIDASATTWTGEVRIAPQYTRALDWVRAGYEAPAGPIASDWRWAGEEIVHEVEVPGAATATFVAPAGFEVATIDGAPAGGELKIGPGRHTVTAREVAS